MFCGTLKKKPGLIIPWLVTMLILNILFSIYSLAVIGNTASFTCWAHCGFLQTNDVKYFISALIVFAVINAITYWMWVVVRSAYKQIKDENTANSYPNVYPMNVVTDQKYTAPM